MARNVGLSVSMNGFGWSVTTVESDVVNLGTIMALHDLIGDGTNSGISNGNGNIVGTSANPIDPRLGPL